MSQLKIPAGAVGHSAAGPFLSQALLEKYLNSKGRSAAQVPMKDLSADWWVWKPVRTRGNFPPSS